MTVGRFLAAAVVAGALAATGAAAPSSPAGEIFRVRPDPRMCPSPLCGGFWAARVNRSTTRCADGTTRAWCYVASIDLGTIPASARAQIQIAEQSGGLLVRGRIVSRRMSGFGPLGHLVATGAWLAAAAAPWSGTVFLVTDTGVRCVRAPCFSLRAAIVNTARAVSASGLDLSPVGARRELVRRAEAALTGEGVFVAGSTRRDADGGRTVVATQFFLQPG